MSSKFFVSFVFLILSFTVKSEKAVITGSAPEWKGLKARLIIETDPISRLDSVVDVGTIDAEGDFTLEVDLDKTQRYWIHVNRFKAPIYLGPNDSLRIELLPNPKNQLVSTWQNGSFEYTFINLDTLNINTQIAKFDREYYNFYLQNAPLLGTAQMRNTVLDFESEQKEKIDNSFIGVYIKYSIAEMKLSSGFNKATIFQDYLDSAELVLHNPAWLSFFLTFYSDYFTSFDNRFKGATVYNRFNKGMEVSNLDSLMATDPYLPNDSLRALTALHAVEEVLSDPNYWSSSLLEVCHYYEEITAHEELKTIAQNLSAKIQANSKNTSVLAYLPSSMKLEDEGDERPIVLMVTKPSINSDKKERLLMRNLIEKYPEIIRACEISIEDGPLETSWETSFMDDPYDLFTLLDIYAFPHYLWVSPDGMVLENPVERPSQGLEVKLYKIQMEKKKAETIKVGQ